MKASWMCCLTNTAPIGTQPLVMPLATVIRSGTTPVCSIANHLPVRPKPLITSSAISRMPYLSQISRRIGQYSGGGT